MDWNEVACLLGVNDASTNTAASGTMGIEDITGGEELNLNVWDNMSVEEDDSSDEY